MAEEAPEVLAEKMVASMFALAEAYSDRLLQFAASGQLASAERGWRDDNYVSEFDEELHEEYRRRLLQILPSFAYASEEGEIEILPPGCGGVPAYIAIVDPLDTSELAVRGLAAYSQVLVYSTARQCPIVAVVGDLFHRARAFYAFRRGDGAHTAQLKTCRGQVFPLRPSPQAGLNRALVTNYLMRPAERFGRLAAEQRLLAALSEPDEAGIRRGRLGVDFGSVGLCHVAAGFTDAMIEVAKGFPLWDIAPGAYILLAAGGSLAGLDGVALTLDSAFPDMASLRERMRARQKFVAAGNPALMAEILRWLGQPASREHD